MESLERRLNILKDSRILVTGGSGYIGSHLIAKLVAEGAHVIAIARHQYKLDRLKKDNAPADIETIKCDVAEPQQVLKVKEQVGNIDYLVHLVMTSPKASGIQDTIRGAQNDIVGTCNVLGYLGQGVKRVCFSSSGEVYGAPKYLPIDEKHPTEPQNYYGVTKLASEAYMRVFSETNCPVIALRFSLVYGAGEPINRAIPQQITATLEGSSPIVYGDGMPERDYVYVEDAAEAILLSLKCKATSNYNVYNISSRQVYKDSEVAEMIIRLCGNNQAPTYDLGKIVRVGYCLDTTAARRDLGYLPKIELEEGIGNEIAWLKGRDNVK